MDLEEEIISFEPADNEGVDLSRFSFIFSPDNAANNDFGGNVIDARGIFKARRREIEEGEVSANASLRVFKERAEMRGAFKGLMAQYGLNKVFNLDPSNFDSSVEAVDDSLTRIFIKFANSLKKGRIFVDSFSFSCSPKKGLYLKIKVSAETLPVLRSLFKKFQNTEFSPIEIGEKGACHSMTLRLGVDEFLRVASGGE